MKLFLANQDFDSHANRLRLLVRENTNALVVFNARDYKVGDGGEGFQSELFAKNSFNFHQLDLCDYFDKETKLNKFVYNYKPGLAVLFGGNTFLL